MRVNKRMIKSVILIIIIIIVILLINKNMRYEIGTTIKRNYLSVFKGNITALGYAMNEKTDNIIGRELGQNVAYLGYIESKRKEYSINIYDPHMKDIKSNYDIYENVESDNRKEADNQDNEKNNKSKNNKNKNNKSNNNKSKNNKNNGNLNKQTEVVSELPSEEKLRDFSFLMSNMYVVTNRTYMIPEDLDYDKLMSTDLKMKSDNSKPQILIYHSHSHEGFVDTTDDTQSNIVAVGAYLAKLLSEKYGYNVIHCTESFDEVNGVFDRSKAYTYARVAVTQILEKYPSIEVVMDIHRDGLPDDSPKLLTYIDGRPTAQIMLFNGNSRNTIGEVEYLYNPYRDINTAFSFRLKLKGMELYPEYTRKNYVDAYQYNQHLRGKSVLIEVGAQNNTFEEVQNSMLPLSHLLDEILKGN